MALRLNPDASPATTGADPQELAARAAAALARGDLQDFQALAATAAAIDEPVDRYQARTRVFEQALGASRTTSIEKVPGLLATVAAAIADALDEEPREPVLLNYLGVVLYELGALDTAERLFRAAQRLDPRMPAVETNLANVADRRRRRADVRSTLPANVRAALPHLEQRGDRFAAQAQPKQGQKLSLCMIVRDEEEMLPRCLEAVHEHVDEIVIVDTGSVDRTIEIARSFGARVIEQEWTGSFADARNRSFDEATGDWLIFLDADEVVVAEDAPLLRKLTGQTWREAYDLTEISFTGELEDGNAVTHNALRMFRNRPQYRFEGRLHEQIANKLPALPERIESVPVRIEHYGYLGKVRDAKAKSRRNVELLEQQMADGVDNAFLHFNLGSEYGAVGDAELALKHLQIAWRMVCADRGPQHYGFTPSLCSRLVKALRVTGRPDEAIGQADEGLTIFPGFTDLVLEQAMCERARGNEQRAKELFERCLTMGDAPAVYTATVGAGTFLAQLALSESHRLLGDSETAERLLMDSLGTYPSFLAVVLPLADLLLARGVDAEEVERTIVDGLDELTPSACFMLGTALYEAGAVERAEPHFRTVVAKQPTSGPARVALAETLLSQMQYAEAAEVAAGVEDESPWRPASLVTEVVARMLAGDLEGASASLERSGSSLPAEQRTTLTACVSVLAGGSAPDELPADAAPVLLTMLEAMLRLHEVDTFGALVGLVDRVGLSWRAAREALARMYLRRGFLESAADEWIAVCERNGADVAAYVGLSQVAYARGMNEDAQLFAQEARLLDPHDETAERLVIALAA